MQLTVNGRPIETQCPAETTLLSLLRNELHLTGTKLVCDRGECGACTVLIDGELAYACLTLAVACDGQAITTIEGLAEGGALHPLQQAFVEHDALQCGFCTPGQILAAVALLRRHPAPDESDIVREMSGNLCRCGTYPKIVRAILAAAPLMRNGHGAAAD